MAALKAAVSDGVQSNFSFEFLPTVALSNGAITAESAGKCPINVLYKPFHELTCLLVTRFSSFVSPREVMVWFEGKIQPSTYIHKFQCLLEKFLLCWGLALDYFHLAF